MIWLRNRKNKVCSSDSEILVNKGYPSWADCSDEETGKIYDKPFFDLFKRLHTSRSTIHNSFTASSSERSDESVPTWSVKSVENTQGEHGAVPMRAKGYGNQRTEMVEEKKTGSDTVIPACQK